MRDMNKCRTLLIALYMSLLLFLLLIIIASGQSLRQIIKVMSPLLQAVCSKVVVICYVYLIECNM